MRKLILGALAGVLLVGILFAGVNAQTYWQRFDNVLVKNLDVTGTSTLEGATTVGGALTVAGATTFAGGTSTTGAISTDSNLTVGGNATVTGTSNLVGNTTVAGTFAANGTSLTVAKPLWMSRQTSIAVTEGSIITPTGTFQELTAAGAVTGALSAPTAAGQLLILFNSTSNNITLSDGSGQAFAGDIVLGLNDRATLISTQAGSWVELARSNN